MKTVFFSSLSAASLSLVCVSAMAAEPVSPVSVSVGADVVSSYVWRGQDCGGFSVQPSVEFAWDKAGLTLGVWASAELFENSSVANMNEFDLSLSWSPIEALSIGVTDYYFYGDKYFGTWNFGGEASHNLEMNLGYDFGPLALSWNTVLTGPDYNVKGDRAYTTYVEVTAPWKMGGVECEAALGASLWDDAFTQAGTDGFKVCNVSLKASKELLKLPFFGQIVANPASDKVFFVVGLSF